MTTFVESQRALIKKPSQGALLCRLPQSAAGLPENAGVASQNANKIRTSTFLLKLQVPLSHFTRH